MPFPSLTTTAPARPARPMRTVPTPRRRTIVKGAAWSVPLVVVASEAAHAGISTCAVNSSVSLGPNTTVSIRAVCQDRAQDPSIPPGSSGEIMVNYGTGSLPSYLEICNCQNQPQWYRWRETDTRDNFQIEVDGLHNDQNSSTAGYRPAFLLESFGATGGCRRFALTYRASSSLPYPSTDNVTITWTLQRGSSNQGPWTTVETFTRTGTVKRNQTGNVNFDRCRAQTPSAAGTTATTQSVGTGD